MPEYKINRKNILGVDIIMVHGQQGKGKTCFCFEILSQDYHYHGKERTKLATKFNKELNEKYGYNLHIDGRHLYYTNIAGYLDSACTVKTWACDFSKFAIPNDDFEVDYFPPYSVLFFTELDIQAFCRNWQQFSDWYIFLFKYFRHMHYTIVFDLQKDGMLDKALRGLCTLSIYIKEAQNKESFLFKKVKGRTTRFKMTAPFDQDVARESRLIKGQRKNFGETKDYVHYYKGNIFKQYNSFSAIPYFLYKIKDWSFKEHEETDLSPEGVKRYRELHPLVLPKKKKESSTTKTKKASA